MTVNSGVTLSIDETANLSFSNNSSLIVNGILNANGLSDDRIVFDFISPNSTNENGIKLNSGGLLNLSYVDIKNAYNGVKAVPTYNTSNIDNCNIQDCYNGISVVYGNKDPDINITNNNISEISSYGISIVNSTYGTNVEPVIYQKAVMEFTSTIPVH